MIAGSNPRRLESIGSIVPAKPDRLTDTNIETATTKAKAAECQSGTHRPDHDRAHAAEDARRLHLPAERLHQRLQLYLAGREPRTTIVTD